MRVRNNDRLVLIWLAMAIAAVLFRLAGIAHGADLQRGTTFSDGQRITASDLHDLVDDATIVSGFFVNKSAASSLTGSDLFMVYNAASSSYLKITANAALYQNTAFITGQSEKTAPVTGDFLLLYDTSGTTLKKVQVGSLILNNTNLIASQPIINRTNLSYLTVVPVLNNGTNGAATFASILSFFNYTNSFTNLTLTTLPIAADRILLFDSVLGTNKNTTLASVRTNVFQQTYTSAQFAFSIGVKLNAAHGFPGTPQSVRVVLVETNSLDAFTGYVAGDEVDVSTVDEGSAGSGSANFTYGANATNIFVICNNASLVQMATKTNAARVAISAAANWNIKAYATYLPP